MEDDINRRICKKLGIEWHEIEFRYAPNGMVDRQRCTCKEEFGGDIAMFRRHCKNKNPDFITDPVSLLRVIVERKHSEAFIYWLYNRILEKHDGYDPLKYFIEEYLIDTTGKLAQAVDEWLPEPEEGK